MRVETRLGGGGDLDAAVELWSAANAARRAGDPSPVEAKMCRATLGKQGVFFVLAEEDGAPVGLAAGMQGLADDGAGPPIPGLCHLSLVCVRPDRWGRGIAKRLVIEVLGAATERGHDRAQLWAHADNARACRLYESLGFTPSGRTQSDPFGETIRHYELAALVRD